MVLRGPAAKQTLECLPGSDDRTPRDSRGAGANGSTLGGSAALKPRRVGFRRVRHVRPLHPQVHVEGPPPAPPEPAMPPEPAIPLELLELLAPPPLPPAFSGSGDDEHAGVSEAAMTTTNNLRIRIVKPFDEETNAHHALQIMVPLLRPRGKPDFFQKRSGVICRNRRRIPSGGGRSARATVGAATNRPTTTP